MFRFTHLFAILALIASPLTVSAAESKFDVVIGQGQSGPQVTAVTPGGVASFMGLQKGDRITAYSFNGERRPANKPTDLEEFLAGKTGKYRLEVARLGVAEPIVIAGSVELRDIPAKTGPPKAVLVFMPDRPKK
jgi:C-terminal processing protease CtpA/Prc